MSLSIETSNLTLAYLNSSNNLSQMETNIKDIKLHIMQHQLLMVLELDMLPIDLLEAGYKQLVLMLGRGQKIVQSVILDKKSVIT